jgi:hypothetical protein
MPQFCVFKQDLIKKNLMYCVSNKTQMIYLIPQKIRNFPCLKIIKK